MSELEAMCAELNRRAREEADAGGEMFLGVPDRWFELPGPKYRCVNDHVSKRVLKSVTDLCVECQGRLALTFPEDEDGVLEVAP